MFSREKHYFYYTPALPDYLSGEKEVKDFPIHDAGWYEKNGIELFLETEIAKIELPENTAVTRKGNKSSFDKLLLACGGKSLVPPIPGSSNGGVLTLRTVDDADGIRKRARESQRAVVIAEAKKETVIRRDEARRAYRKFLLQDNRIIGAIFLGDTRGKEEVQRAIQSKRDISSFKKELAEEGFDFTRLK